jgi:hypothetical protein
METENTTKAAGKKRRWIIGFVALAVVFLIAIAVWPGEREPEYQGKKLSEWLGAYHRDYSTDAEREAEQRRADYAVRQIGTNGLPYLLQAVSYDAPAWRRRLPVFLYRLPFHWSVLFPSDKRSFEAVEGFRIWVLMLRLWCPNWGDCCLPRRIVCRAPKLLML